MEDWIDINDSLPTPEDKKYRKYRVKMVVGSIETKIVEDVVLGRVTGTGFRFVAGDWKTVTHWQNFESNEN